MLYAALVGGVIGAVGGHAIAALVLRLRGAELLDQRLDFYFAIPTALVIFGVAELAGAYGLVAAFTAGVAFRRYEFGTSTTATSTTAPRSWRSSGSSW